MGDESIRLRDVIEAAYRVFGHYEVRHALSVCHCNVCMNAEDERRLLTTPLRTIPASLLAEYTNSAHGWDDEQIAREFRYFLPRYFELIAQNDPPDHLGICMCLNRMGDAPWRETWPKAEVDIIDRFFDALIRVGTQQFALTKSSVGWELHFDLREILTLVVTANGDIHRVLSAWDTAPDPGAVVHMAALRTDLIFDTGRTYFSSRLLDNHKEAAHHIGAFLARPEVVLRMEAALSMLDDPHLQEFVSEAAAAR